MYIKRYFIDNWKDCFTCSGAGKEKQESGGKVGWAGSLERNKGLMGVDHVHNLSPQEAGARELGIQG